MELIRKTGTNQLKYKTTTQIVTKENINEIFLTLPNRRDIRNGVVNKITNLLREGKHFETPLMCNYKEGVYRLLDGNHRFEAMSKFFEYYPERRIEVKIHYYTDLTEDQEKKEYAKWNCGTKQSTKDLLKAYWEDLEIVKHLKSPPFPCKVNYTWGKNTMDLQTLLAVYLVRNEKTVTYSGGGFPFLEKVESLDKQDANILKSFMSDYMLVFGQVDKNNPHYKPCFFYSVMNIWLSNYNNFNSDTIVKRFSKLVGHARVYDLAGQGGSYGNVDVGIDQLLVVLNGNIKQPKLLFGRNKEE